VECVQLGVLEGTAGMSWDYIVDTITLFEKN
jgi:hypothetical protein